MPEVIPPVSNSINTNVGAMVALASLRTTQSALHAASKQVQTGYRVSDASDDASTFSVAQGIRGNLQAFQAVQGSLANGVGLGQVTMAALTNISDLIGNLQAKSTQYLDGSISANQQNIYGRDAIQLYNQISNFISQANYNGVNLLSSGSVAKTFLADVSATTLPMSSQSSISTALTTYQPAMPTLFTVSLGTLATFKEAVDNALGQVAAETRTLKLQSGFIDSVMDATTTGLGAVVDADIGKAAASVQALQVRQQLGIQSLSIANQQPSVLLGLFR
ncbi:MAG: flagellin [Alphaproteobacteria bacterium]|nr:flagellin [Alphaproteobacteria bacterium]